MDKEKQKYPRAVAGVYIFNDKGELFLMRSSKWQDQYVPPGGMVELGETLEETAKRETKEETNLDIYDIKFICADRGIKLGNAYSGSNKDLIFLSHQAKTSNADNIKLNEEGDRYKWLKVSEWLKRKDIEQYTRIILGNYLKDNNDFENKYKLALADYQNLLKRTAEEKAEFAKYANQELVMEILPVYDNLKLALFHAQETPNNANIISGIGYVIKQFKDALENLGVEEIKIKAGDKFDHHLMEAVEGRGEKVKQVLKPGYKLRGKVIVAAKVIVE